MQQTAERRCLRCRPPLAEGSQFCVACGCSNECLDERLHDAIGRADRRIAWAPWRKGLYSVIGGLLRMIR